MGISFVAPARRLHHPCAPPPLFNDARSPSTAHLRHHGRISSALVSTAALSTTTICVSNSHSPFRHVHRADSYYGHEGTSNLCARFFNHTFNFPEIIPLHVPLAHLPPQDPDRRDHRTQSRVRATSTGSKPSSSASSASARKLPLVQNPELNLSFLSSHLRTLCVLPLAMSLYQHSAPPPHYFQHHPQPPMPTMHPYAPPSLSVQAPAPSTFWRDYTARLSELTMNLRPIIQNLTMMAQNFTLCHCAALHMPVPLCCLHRPCVPLPPQKCASLPPTSPPATALLCHLLARLQGHLRRHLQQQIMGRRRIGHVHAPQDQPDGTRDAWIPWVGLQRLLQRPHVLQ